MVVLHSGRFTIFKYTKRGLNECNLGAFGDSHGPWWTRMASTIGVPMGSQVSTLLLNDNPNPRVDEGFQTTLKFFSRLTLH